MKFGQNYTCEIYLHTGEKITINYPITCDFDINRGLYRNINEGTFTFYNLKEDTRRKLFKDFFDYAPERMDHVIFKAGYSDIGTIEIFKGNIKEAYSSRQGTDNLTRMSVWDGCNGVMNGFSSLTLPKSYSKTEAIKLLIKTMPGISLGNISTFDNLKVSSSSRGACFMGNSWDLISEINQDGFNFIDKEVAHSIQLGEFFGSVMMINADTGLLDTPKRSDVKLVLKTLFEPRANVGEIAEVSSREKVNNGQFQIIGIHHSGRMSGAICGTCTTGLEMYLGAKRRIA